MLKITDGERTICAGPYLDEKGIVAAITNLRDLIKEIGKYPDKSLFFQNPIVLEGWIQMVRLLQGVKKWEVPEGDEQWVECAEIYVANLFEMRALCDSYKEIYKIYHNHLWKLLEFYNGWLEGEYISFDCMDALYEDKYEKGLQDVENIGQYAAQLNKESHEARFAVDTILSHAYDLLMAIMNRGGKVIIDLYPTESDFALAFDADIRTRTRSIKEQMFKDMEEELARHYMECRTDDYTPQMWSKMLVADEDALKMAKKKQLSKCEEPNQEHWGKDIKAKMDGNSKLMEKILSLIKTKELFDLGKPENVKPLIGLLEPENLSLFYDIIIRRSLIQCEMFPNLKEQHETWLYGGDKQSDKRKESEVIIERQTNSDKQQDFKTGKQSSKPVPKCFRNASEFVQEKVKSIVNDFYLGSAANLALIEIAFYDHNLLLKRNEHKALIKTLVAWGAITCSDVKKTANSMAYKMGKVPSCGYEEWDDILFVNDKKTCIDIGKILGETIPYSRKREE